MVQEVLAAMRRIQAAAGVSQGQHAVITNGRLVIVPNGRLLTPEEFQLMNYVAMHLQPGKKVLEIILEAQEIGRTAMASPEGAPSACGLLHVAFKDAC